MNPILGKLMNILFNISMFTEDCIYMLKIKKTEDPLSNFEIKLPFIIKKLKKLSKELKHQKLEIIPIDIRSTYLMYINQILEINKESIINMENLHSSKKLLYQANNFIQYSQSKVDPKASFVNSFIKGLKVVDY